jgi:hypothetical protein
MFELMIERVEMLYDKYIVLGAACFFAFMQGAASDSEHRKEESLLNVHSLQLKDCFSLEKLVAIGLHRNYAVFTVSKLFKKVIEPGYILLSDADVLMGCVGVVDGPNAAQVAASIESFAMRDLSWAPVGPENKAEDIARRNRARERAYLLSATNNQPQAVSVSFVWFESTKTHRDPLEVCENGIVKQLREKILPLSVEATVQHLKQQNVENPLEQIATEAKAFSYDHEATYLKFDRFRYAQLLEKEFGKEPSHLIDALLSQSDK